tara:strand:+ start:1041 stop:1844 length:804 start_codon:yes stop_codon:yes gene_type:complete
MFIFGCLYAFVGVMLAMWMFRSEASMVLVFLTAFACIPLIYHTIKAEERRDEKIKSRGLPSWRTHRKAIYYFLALSLGFIFMFSLFNIFMPEQTITQVFQTQIDTINYINQRTTGDFVEINKVFFEIVANNINVLLFCFIFSFFFGAGAIFILTWNSSVIAVAVGNFARNKLGQAAGAVGINKVAAYFTAFSLGFWRYMLHGIFEILAYFVAGLAGGIISVAIIHHEVGSANFKKVFKDSMYLFGLALIIILIGAVVEVYITPRLFY